MAQNEKIKPSILLGSAKHDTQLGLEIFVEQRLTEAGMRPETERFETQEAAFQAVLEGKIAAFACPLHQAPMALPLGLVITALTRRDDARNLLFSLDQDEALSASTKPRKVLTISDISRAQMQYLYPEDIVEKQDFSPDESVEALKSGSYDAVVLCQSDANPAVFINTVHKYQAQSFSVREFIPQAGQGTACFITAEDDLPTRRLLQTAHHSAVSAVTNIERTVQKLLPDHEVCAYCERDRMGNYHLWTAALIDNVLHRTRLSQSTSFGMAEKAVEQLFSA
jgi:porphobilinogen deaminase